MKFRYVLVLAAILLATQSMLAQGPSQVIKPEADPVAWLADFETRLTGTTESSQRMFLLRNMAPAALAAKDEQRAAKFSKELADLGLELRSVPGFGPGLYSDATFISNTVLGHIALKNGQLETAKEHLLNAGDVTGSSVLNSFGPGMSLAKELLDRGERETVIKYLDQCSKFWRMDRGSLAKWKTAIENGNTPNFGLGDLRRTLDTWKFTQ